MMIAKSSNCCNDMKDGNFEKIIPSFHVSCKNVNAVDICKSRWYAVGGGGGAVARHDQCWSTVYM